MRVDLKPAHRASILKQMQAHRVASARLNNDIQFKRDCISGHETAPSLSASCTRKSTRIEVHSSSTAIAADVRVKSGNGPEEWERNDTLISVLLSIQQNNSYFFITLKISMLHFDDR